MLEIYKEILFDLLNNTDVKPNLRIKDHPKKGPYIDGLFTEYIENKEDLIEWILLADELRVTAETGLNKTSSRSHLLFTLEICQKMPDNSEKIGILNMIDLAGSEKLSKTGAEGDRLKEALKINLSLHTLGNVIHALSSNGSHIPYNESKLTKILKNSLGGNYKTTLIITCSPHLYNVDETISTLHFAQRAKKIKNVVKANIIKSPEELEKIIDELHHQLATLTAKYIKLKEKMNGNIGNGKNKKESLNNIENDDSFVGDSVLDVTNLGQKNLFEMDTLENFNLNQNSPNPKNKNSKRKDELKLLNELSLKDNEIEKLKDEIEGNKEEIKVLNEKIVFLTNEVHFEKNLADLKDLSEDIVYNLLKLKQKYTFEIDKSLENENKELRKRITKMEQDFFTELKSIRIIEKLDSNECSIERLEDEFHNKLNKFNKDLYSQVENIKKNVGSENKELFTSYTSFYANSKIMFSALLQDFLIKDDLLDVENIEPEQSKDENKQNNKKETNHKLYAKDIKIKNSYIKLLLVMTYYEKTLFEALNKISLDIKIASRNEFYQKQYDTQLKRYEDAFSRMEDLLDQIKEMKLYNLNGMNVDTVNEMENGGGLLQMKRKKSTTIRNIRKKFSSKKFASQDEDLQDFGLIKIDRKNSEAGDVKDKVIPLIKFINLEEMKNNEQLKSDNNLHILGSLKNPNNEDSENRIYKNNKMGVTPSHKLKVDNGQERKVPSFVLDPSQPNSSKNLTNLFQRHSFLPEHGKMSDILEIKALKIELEMYKEFSNKQIEELNNIKIYNAEASQNIKEFQARSKNLYEIQCMNFKNCLDILKVIHYVNNNLNRVII